MHPNCPHRGKPPAKSGSAIPSSPQVTMRRGPNPQLQKPQPEQWQRLQGLLQKQQLLLEELQELLRHMQ